MPWISLLDPSVAATHSPELSTRFFARYFFFPDQPQDSSADAPRLWNRFQLLFFRRAHGGDGGDRGDEDMGEHRRTAGRARNAKVGDPVGSQTTEERGFGDRKVRRSERRATTIGSYGMSAGGKVATG